MTVAGFKILGAAAALWLAAAAPGHAQSLSDDKPLRIIVITAPGGAADTAARLLSDGLTKSLKRSVIVENKPGAGGNIATEYVAHLPPDGTAVLLTSNNHTINPTLFHKVNYDYRKSFEPVIQLTRGPSVIAVFPGLEARSIPELATLSRTRSLGYGSTGLGSAGNLAFEMLKKHFGARIDHIPYKGAGPAVADALGGHVPIVSVSLTSAIAFIKEGKLRGLAVTTENRWSELPDVPTLKESGCDTCVYETYLGILAPKGTSAEYVQALNRAIARVLQDPGAKGKLATLGMEPVAGSPQSFAAMLDKDFAQAARVIRDTGMTAN